MPESELLPRAATRSDEPAAPAPADVEEDAGRSPSTAPSSPRRISSTASGSTILEVAQAAQRRPSIWQLPFCAADSSWLHMTNSLVFFLLFCVNVLVNSGAVWASVQEVDEQYGPIVTPAGWSYYIRDLTLFLWGLGVAAQNLAEHKGWKEGLLGTIGHTWQILWYSDSIWLILHVTASPTGLIIAPLFSLCALLAALSTMTRLAWAMQALHEQLQAEGFEGVPALGYLLFAYPTSLAAGWLLVLHCHSTTLATLVLSGSEEFALSAGCVMLVLVTAIALLLLIRFRDVVFGLAFTWSMVAVWVAGFATDDDYRPDQLVAFFCGLVLGLLTYCVAAGPQGGGWLPGPLGAGGGLHS